jgi:hypothetical protein
MLFKKNQSKTFFFIVRFILKLNDRYLANVITESLLALGIDV